MNTADDITKSAAESAPPVIYGALHLFGVSLPDWVAILVAVYTTLQIMHLIWRWRRAARRNGTGD